MIADLMRRTPALLALLVIALASCSDGGHGDDGHGASSEVPEGARTVEVTATSFAFEPAAIEAEPGEALAIELTSDDVEHDFVIDELDAHVSVGAGESATGGFHVGDEPGEYTYYCSVPGHREAGMEGDLVVG